MGEQAAHVLPLQRCTLRCEVLKSAALDAGLVEEGYQRIMALAPEERIPAVQRLVQERPDVYQALRRCCFCGYCTAACRHHVLAADRMRDWRALFMEAGLMPPEDSKSVMVDNEWHIFNAYRAVYGIYYPEFVSLAQAAENGPGLVDTVFFPGCSLVSYAPDLTRKVGAWLTRAGVAWALSDDCCGSPLMSAGLFDRAAGLRERLLGQMRAAGVTRMLTVCPGCGEEFAETFGDEIDIVPLPEFLLEKAGSVPSGTRQLPRNGFLLPWKRRASRCSTPVTTARTDATGRPSASCCAATCPMRGRWRWTIAGGGRSAAAREAPWPPSTATSRTAACGA